MAPWVQAQLVAAMVVEAIEASLHLAISPGLTLSDPNPNPSPSQPEPEPELEPGPGPGPEPLPGRCCDGHEAHVRRQHSSDLEHGFV